MGPKIHSVVKRPKTARFKSEFLGRDVRMGFPDFTLEGRVLRIIREVDAYFYELEISGGSKVIFVSLMDVSWVELKKRESKLNIVK